MKHIVGFVLACIFMFLFLMAINFVDGRVNQIRRINHAAAEMCGAGNTPVWLDSITVECLRDI